MNTPLPPLPKPGETITVKLDVLPEYLGAHGMHIREVTKDLIVILEPKKEQEHE